MASENGHIPDVGSDARFVSRSNRRRTGERQHDAWIRRSRIADLMLQGTTTISDILHALDLPKTNRQTIEKDVRIIEQAWRERALDNNPESARAKAALRLNNILKALWKDWEERKDAAIMKLIVQTTLHLGKVEGIAAPEQPAQYNTTIVAASTEFFKQVNARADEIRKASGLLPPPPVKEIADVDADKP